MFIKKVTKELLKTNKAELLAKIEKLKLFAKEEEQKSNKLTNEEKLFMYTNLEKIFCALIETEKQLKALEEEKEEVKDV